MSTPYDPNQPDPGQQGQPQQPPPDAGQWGQQGYPAQQPAQQPYQPAPAAYGYQVPDHPKATTCLVLGILGIVVCGVIAPFAWQMSKKTRDEIDASGGTLGGRGNAQAGYILGIIGTVLLGLGLVFAVLWLLIVVIAIGGAATSNAAGLLG